MMNKFNGVVLLFMIGIMLTFSPCQAEEISLIVQKSRNILELQDSLKVKYTHILNESEILAQRIRFYRSKESLNTREHHTLQKLLKEAQELSLKKKFISDEMIVFSNQLDSLLTVGLDQIHTDLNFITNQKSKTSLDTSDVSKIDQLLLWKAELESHQKLHKPMTVNRLSLNIQKEDNTADLQIKGDMLLDREDQFRDEIKMIDQRIQSLKVEADVRRKVQDVAAELDLFNEDEELLTRTVPVYSENYPYNNLHYWDERYGIGTGAEKLSSDDASYSLTESLESHDNYEYLRTPEMIEDVISKLIFHKSRLKVIADSLHQTADKFYQEAVEREDSSF